MKRSTWPSRPKRTWIPGLLLAGVGAVLWGCSDGDTGSPTPIAQTQQALTPKTESTVWLWMKDQADLRTARNIKDWKTRGQFVYDQLTRTAKSSQADTLKALELKGVKYKSFWVVNAVRITADKDTINTMARNPAVAKVIDNEVIRLSRPKKEKISPRVNAVEWGLTNINAPQVWSTYGVRGDSITVASIDTGVQFDHPALVNRYRGTGGGSFDHNYNFIDPEGACGATPCDTDGHGSHTTGTMVGDDGAGNQIGVAPSAKFIFGVGLPGGSGSLETLLAVGQWMVAPTDSAGNNPRPDLRPHIVNNSWGGGGSNTALQAMVQSWVAAGMFPVFSNGNGGPACGTVGWPGSYPESYGVGAHDVGNLVADFSSRGPSPLGVGKPEISAPGVNVRSSLPGNTYGAFSGTSMAAPHLAGSVALLWSAAPAILGDINATKAILGQTAIDVNDTSCGGTAGNNNVYGEGRLDAFAAVTAAPRGPSGTLTGTVNGGGSPLAGATVSAGSRNTQTNSGGVYNLTLSAGSVSVTASAFGYASQSATVNIVDGGTTTQNYNLVAAPAHSVSGVVRDADNNPIVGATVSILNTPIAAATTNAAGQYSFASVPEGSYELVATSGKCNDPQQRSLVVDGAESVDFTLAKRVDAFGYSCQGVPFAYIDGTTDVVTGDDATVSVPLPFPFSLYGETYTTAHIATNGHVNFLSQSTAYSNTSIPNSAQPNAAIYGFWDDLNADSSAHIRTATIGTAPNRKFVIDWNNVTFYGNTSRLSFEVILHENGQITMQYKDLPADGRAQGNSATIGLENAAGEIAFQYSNNEAVFAANSAINFRLPPSGVVQGQVKDQNDNLGVGGATVRALVAGSQIRATRTDSQGNYRLQLPVGAYTLEASLSDYQAATANVNIAENATLTQNFSLATARAEVNPGFLEIVAQPDVVRTRALVLRNTGSTNLNWIIGESGGRVSGIASTFAKAKKIGFSPTARTTSGMYIGTNNRGWINAVPGTVLRQFTTPTMPWGVGYNGTLWLSDPNTKKNHEYTTQGAATGRVWNASWATSWNADSAWDSTHNVMCQVNVGGDNGIHCWDPATGAEADSITGGFAWTAVSQRGLAYRSDDDTFYIGGWNEGIIYHVKGLSHPDKGAIIGQCSPSDGSISGLAWNGSARVLWAATNSETDTVYQLSPDTCQVLSTVPHPSPGNHGAGLEMDEVGNLWMTDQVGKVAYLVESGVPNFNDVSWLSVTPTSGSVGSGGSATLGVTVNTSGLAPGVYLATVFIRSNSGRQALLAIPVSVVVSAYRIGINSGGNAYNDFSQDSWTADRKHVVGSYGYIQAGTTKVTNKPIEGTTEPTLYQDQRRNFYAYRFDNVPNGVYEVEMGFAELQNIGPNKRLFDVILENSVVLPAHDIAYEVGSFQADKRRFLVQVSDGRLDARFIAIKSVPVLNSIRVTMRPDH